MANWGFRDLMGTEHDGEALGFSITNAIPSILLNSQEATTLVGKAMGLTNKPTNSFLVLSMHLLFWLTPE